MEKARYIRYLLKYICFNHRMFVYRFRIRPTDPVVAGQCSYRGVGKRGSLTTVAGQLTPGQQHNSFMSIAAVTPQPNVIKLRKSGFILYNSLRRLCASPNLFLGGVLPAIWWFWVELVVQPPGHPQKLYHPQHLSDAL